MTAPDFDSEEAREARFLRFYELQPNSTETDLEASLAAWLIIEMPESFLEELRARLARVRAERQAPPHAVFVESQYVEADDAWEYRRRCSCGGLGVWLRNPNKVAACPRSEVR